MTTTTNTTHFVTIGDNGVGLVVWGVGDTREAAEADAEDSLAETTGARPELVTVPIDADAAELVRGGEVALEQSAIEVVWKGGSPFRAPHKAFDLSRAERVRRSPTRVPGLAFVQIGDGLIVQQIDLEGYGETVEEARGEASRAIEAMRAACDRLAAEAAKRDGLSAYKTPFYDALSDLDRERNNMLNALARADQLWGRVFSWSPIDPAALPAAIKRCVDAARREGWDGAGRYELTESDCDFIVEDLGRKPSREEWAAAGYHSVGGKHVA